jgi:hypothetical protein
MGTLIGQRNARFESSDLVVALEHADLVAETLVGFAVGFEEVDRSDDLGLALLRLADDRNAAASVVRALGMFRKSIAAEPAPDPDPRDPRTDLDSFLRALREYLALRYGGWTPTMGKNRLVGRVEGGGQIGHSGEDDPEPFAGPLPGRLARRPGLGVRVGVLDTTVFSHPYFEGRCLGTAVDVVEEMPKSAVGCHGTFVTGLVLQQAPGCTVEVREVLAGQDGTAKSWEVAKKIVELGRTGLDVLNLSMVCWSEDNQPPFVLAAAIDRLDPDIVVVAAAGNHGNLDEKTHPGERNKPAWPAALDDVVAVGAAANDGEPAAFTPPDAPWIDVWSNGVRVRSAFLTGVLDVPAGYGSPTEEAAQLKRFEGYATWSGSSFAAALVSGAIAARTVPGRTPARAAWNELRNRSKKGAKGKPEDHSWQPPFLNLLP